MTRVGLFHILKDADETQKRFDPFVGLSGRDRSLGANQTHIHFQKSRSRRSVWASTRERSVHAKQE
jgi:hypothetical protein